MFSDWTDPHDIDNYYNDMSGLLADIQNAPSSRMYQQLPVKPKIEARVEQPTGIVINEPVAQTGGSVSIPEVKAAFEVKPNSTFLDGHAVGAPPVYNILRSGSPKENYLDRAQPEHTTKYIDWTYIIMFIMFVFLICLLLQARARACSSDMTIRMLIAMIANKNQ